MMRCVFVSTRTVSKVAGEEVALKFDCTFQEISAADDFQTIERTIQDVIRDVLRNSDRQISMQPLFISEDGKSSLLNPAAAAANSRSLRRTKSPHTADIKDMRNADKETRMGQKKTPSSFKIFNKRFNLFN